MPDIWLTSDQHLSHTRILELDNRPFETIEEHDEVLRENYNKVVGPDDLVVFLGDVALGTIAQSLPQYEDWNGNKVLIPGNHDRVSRVYPEDKREKFWERYQEYFAIYPEIFRMPLDKYVVKLSHYPYDGDHTAEDRYTNLRPVDNGVPLIHGHTHSRERFSLSAKGTAQVNVGVMAWNWFPVNLEQVIELLDNQPSLD